VRRAGGERAGSSVSRRAFLAASAAAMPLAGTLPGLGTFLPGGLRRGRLGAIGIQLYTVRRELVRDVEGTLARLAEIGYTEVEFAGFPNTTAKLLRGILDRLHLTAPSSHVPVQAIRGEWARFLEDAATVGQRYIAVAYVGESERKSADDWKRLAGQFNTAGEAARRAGIQFCYHNHDFEFGLLDGTPAYDLLLRESDPKLVRMELDLYWIAKGGRDPLDYFAKWPGRFPLVHVKDMDATPRRFFADVGTGTIDFRRIFRKAGQAGIRHCFYEQDETPGSPFDSARTSYRYLRQLTY
jgi:sugar phosphate isomerase/epimerase